MNKSVESIIGGVYSKIEKRYRFCFFAAVICGLMAHIFVMTNHLYNYDELWHIPAGFGTGIELGRWALSVTVWIQKILFVDCYTIPVINGLITILCHAIAACLVVSVCEIKDSFFAAMTGALMTTFPALTTRMFSIFTAHYYAMGVMIVALGVWLLFKKKHSVINVILSFALLVFGTAFYQSNYVTGACMVVTYLLITFIRRDAELKIAIRNCINCVLYLGIGMALYLISCKIFLAATGREMMTQEGMNTMGQLSFSQLITALVRCYKTFVKIPFVDVYSMNPNRITKLAFLICLVVLLYTLIRVWKMKKELHIKILITLIMAVLPVAVNLIIIMAIASGTMYSIMVFDVVFMMIIPVACLDALRETDESNTSSTTLNLVLNCCISVALFASVMTYIWFANGNYLAVKYTNDHDNAYYQVLMTQIKSVDGYKDTMPIAMVGKPVHDSTHWRKDMIGDTFDLGCKSSSNAAVYSSWNIMTRVLGFDPVVKDSDEDEASLVANEEVKSMPNYPADGSIKVIDDTIVIKFQDFSELEKTE